MCEARAILFCLTCVMGVVVASDRHASAQDKSSNDWPCWRGPHHNGISAEADWDRSWPVTGPKIAWKASVGNGFSSFAVAGGRVYTMGNTKDVDTVFCLDAETGKALWKHDYPCPLTPLSYEGGPSATPAVDGDWVYTLSKSGQVFCLDAATGDVVWSKKLDAAPRQDGDYAVDWGYAASPLVLGEKLVLSVGWAGMALNKSTGKLIWDNGPGRPGYSTPVPFTLGGRQGLAMLVARGVVAVEADSGKLLWTIPWRTTWDQNAPDVLVSDGKLFVSTGHGVGCALYEIAGGTPKEIWRNKNMRNELSSSVLWRGFVYGFDSNRLVCIAWPTGERQWSESGLGRGTLTLVDGHLVALGDQGKLVLAETNSEGFKALRTLPMPAEGRYWTAPVFSGGRIFIRNAVGDVVCMDVRK
ncbi:MAG: PQQ-binding-like beta-propeller repeat protein [Planctomycetota bacterium]|nr:PQQ-binding-like beta-propeller repeat protein [Planctomycetota bacterium]